MSEQEQKVINVKYQSVSVGKMDGIKLKAASAALLAKIHVITGWNFSEEKEYQNILKDQFIKLLLESYSNVNCDEIEFAFRQYPVKDWGKNMNLNLISEVMNPYLENRLEVSRIEESLSKPKELPAAVEKMTDNEFLETNKNIFKGSKLFTLISPKCYDILTREGKIKLTEEEKKVIGVKARSHFFSAENRENITNTTHAEQERWIRDNSKRIAVAEYFNELLNQ